MATQFSAVETYRETLERTRREAEEALTTSMNGLVGKHIRISGKSVEATGVLKSIIPNHFSRPFNFAIEIVDETEEVVKTFFFPNREDISVIEEP